MVWEYLKTLVYEIPTDFDEELHAKLSVAAATVLETSGSLGKVRQSLTRRYQICIDVNDKKFEQIL